MNYRHIYHAGNICDVVKHATLTLLLDYLCEKDKPFCMLDTHAGIGLYDLLGAEALKTNEAQNGILAFLKAPPLTQLKNYYKALKTLNPDWELGGETPLHFYPGSPLLTCLNLREKDRLIASELHEEDFRTLRYRLYPYPQSQVHHRDGYEALRAFLPPVEKRGLALIDPPFENPDEWDRLTASVVAAYKAWPQGHYMIWYPIKERPLIWRFHEAMIASGVPKQLCAEFIYEDEVRTDRLNGCGLLLINPPWRMDEKIRDLFPALHEAMKTPHRGMDVKWLAGER